MRRHYHKHPYQSPRDKRAFSATLREIGARIQCSDVKAGLSRANDLLASLTISRHEQARVLGMVGDSEFLRGAFNEALTVYQRAATLCFDHHDLWLRPIIGQVLALLKNVRVDDARMIARHACDISAQKCAAFDEQVSAANEEMATGGSVTVPSLPPRISVVATRMGFLFLDEGEPDAAEEFFQRAVTANPRGACRARQGLARIALVSNPARALDLAAESIRIGHYGAKTIAAWAILIAARRKLGGWQISQTLLNGLEMATPSVRARAVLAITRELRNSDMRQWREVADRWLQGEGKKFPIIEAEIRKMYLASAKVQPGDAKGKRELAEALMRTPGLSRNEWLAAAKEAVRAGFWEGTTPDVDALVQFADNCYGGDSGLRAAHSLALSCMMAKRHDLARKLLQRNLAEAEAGRSVWAKSLWALARMENVLGNYTSAASLYKRFSETQALPMRFRLQAGTLWIQALLKGGEYGALLAARPAIEAMLTEVRDPETLMDFARQLALTSPELQTWAVDLFEKGAALAIEQFEEASHPSVALDILFKLTRRQVYDFGRSHDAIKMWEGLNEQQRTWLWSTQQRYWEYLGLLLRAYGRAGSAADVDGCAKAWLKDVATPPEGRVQVGTVYGEWLIESRRVPEALALFDQLIREAPTHPQCARSWYWKALGSFKRGDARECARCVQALRLAQGTNVGLLDEWKLDAKALLLLADLDPTKIDAQAVNYRPDFLSGVLEEIHHDLALPL